MASTAKSSNNVSTPEGLPEIKVGELFAGAYRIIRLLGEGGMGSVYLARDIRSGDREVALKILHPENLRPGMTLASGVTFSSLGGQSAEARFLASCEHPSILPVYDAGTDPVTGLTYFTMRACLLSRDEMRRLCDEIVRCPYPRSKDRWDAGSSALTLRDLLKGGKALPEAAVARIGIDIVEALAYTHVRKPPLVHRDIKPSNILFDANGRAILSDFGIAKEFFAKSAVDSPESATQGAADPAAPQRHRFAGTSAYAAPEQKDGGTAIQASDYYSLGVVLHEALTGERLRGACAPSAFAPKRISRQWDTLLPRLLADNPAERLSDPEELLRALGEILRRHSPRLPRILASTLLSAAALAALAGTLLLLLRGPSAPPAPLPDPDPLVLVPRSPGATMGQIMSLTATSPVYIAKLPAEAVNMQKRIQDVMRRVKETLEAPEWPPPSTNFFPKFLLPPRPENNRRHSAGQVFEMRLPGGTPIHFMPVTTGPGKNDRLGSFRHGDYIELRPGVQRYGVEQTIDDRYMVISKRLLVSRTEVTREQFNDVLSATNAVPLWELRGSDITNAPAFMAATGMGQTEYGHRLPHLLNGVLTDGKPLSEYCSRTVFVRRPLDIPPPQGMPAAEGIRFADVERFVAKLNSLCPAGCVFRLPSEAEWEFICRSASNFRFGGQTPGEVCWSRENSGGTPHPVAQKRPNPFGAFDMHGNVAEWCLDGFRPLEGPAFDPVLPLPSNGWHVVRGGSWADPASECGSDSRRGAGPEATGIGFRLVLEY